jgi:mannosyltransferase OCH1-like enzyme
VIRLEALINSGGIYLDIDVFVYVPSFPAHRDLTDEEMQNTAVRTSYVSSYDIRNGSVPGFPTDGVTA